MHRSYPPHQSPSICSIDRPRVSFANTRVIAKVRTDISQDRLWDVQFIPAKVKKKPDVETERNFSEISAIEALNSDSTDLPIAIAVDAVTVG